MGFYLFGNSPVQGLGVVIPNDSNRVLNLPVRPTLFWGKEVYSFTIKKVSELCCSETFLVGTIGLEPMTPCL